MSFNQKILCIWTTNILGKCSTKSPVGKSMRYHSFFYITRKKSMCNVMSNQEMAD